MKNRLLKTLCIGLLMVILLPGVLACPGPDNEGVITSGNRDPNKITLVTPEPKAGTPPGSGEVFKAFATPDDGAIITVDGMTLSVPAGAVASEELVQVIILDNITFPDIGSMTDTDLPPAAPISLVYDLGPDGIKFDKPVTVTLPYIESLLTSSQDEKNVQVAYFNGVDWVAVGGKVDAVNNTVTAQLTAFPGIQVIVMIEVAAAIPLVHTAVNMWGNKLYGWWVSDPVKKHNAYEYITPKNATVQKFADYFTIDFNGPTPVTMNDLVNNPQKIAEWSDTLGYIKLTDGANKYPLKYKVFDQADDWLLPEKYLNEGRVGDCKNVANAMASMLRSKKIPAKCVDGFLGERIPENRHIWVEFAVDGRPYYIGADGEVQTLEKAYENFDLRRPEFGADYMWDENGQVQYKMGWWLQDMEVKVDASYACPGGRVNIEVSASAIKEMYVQLKIIAPDGSSYYKENGMIDKTGIFQVSLPVALQDPIGTYTVMVENVERGVTSTAEYEVFDPVILVLTEDRQYSPGDTINFNVLFFPESQTSIKIEGVSGQYKTNDNGLVLVSLKIPGDARPGQYEIVVSAPEYSVTGYGEYTVAGGVVTTHDFNLAYIEMKLGIDFTDFDGQVSSYTNDWAGVYVRGAVSGNQFTGEEDLGKYGLPVKVTYIIVLSSDFSRVVSGSYTFTGDDGYYSSVNFSDVPAAFEGMAGPSDLAGMDKTGYVIKGSAVMKHINDFKITEPDANGQMTRYWADETCELVIILASATETQLKALMGE